MAQRRMNNPSTLVTVLVSSVSALVGAAVVHQLWRSGKIGGDCPSGSYRNSAGECVPVTITGYTEPNPRRRRRR